LEVVDRSEKPIKRIQRRRGCWQEIATLKEKIV
jgi:hypothetical protein